MHNITKALKCAIINLSLDPEHHINSNPSFCHMYDELMIDFETAYEDSISEENPLNVIHVNSMQSLVDFNSYLDSISGENFCNVWSHEGFLSSPEWGEIRNFAKKIILENGW